MKIPYKYFNVIGILIIMLILICCKEMEFKPSYFSLDINESKLKHTFICEYKIKKIDFNDFSYLKTNNFNYNEIWLEKKWSSYLDKNGEEKFNVFESSYQLIINFKDDHIFTKDIYWGKFVIRDEKGNTMESDKGILSLDIDSLTYKSSVIKLLMIKVENKFAPNFDTLKLGHFLLKKQ